MAHSERKTGAPSSEQEPTKPEAWLDQERERLYRELIDDVKKAHENGKTGGEYLAELIKNHATDYGTKVRFGNWLKPTDYDKIKFILLNSKSLNEVAGTLIERPLFLIEDAKLYQRIEGMFDLEAGGSHGVHFSPGFFDKKTAWEKVGLIIVKNREVTAIHETRHSVDPSLAHGSDKRTGYNHAVAELFAFYKEYILDKNPCDWSGLTERVSEYHDSYTNSASTKPKLTQAEYAHKIKMAVDGLKKLRDKDGDVKTQRKLVQTKTLDELIAHAA